MCKKKFCILLMSICVVLSSFAFEKANKTYAKQAKLIALLATGWNSSTPNITEHEVFILLGNFRETEWIISIASSEGVILSGVFHIVYAYNDIYPQFKLTGINNQTDEKVDIYVEACDNWGDIRIRAEEKNEEINISLNSFEVSTFWPYSKILFNDCFGCYDINDILADPGWKIGTPKQLKICLSQNPYLRKYK